MLPILFALVILEIGSPSLQRPGPRSSHYKLPAIAGLTGMGHHTQLVSVEMGSHKLFYPGWPGTRILLISASCEAWEDRHEPLTQFLLTFLFPSGHMCLSKSLKEVLFQVIPMWHS
jgi:hypothetical protein